VEARRDLYVGADAAGALFSDGLVEAVDPDRPCRDVGATGEYNSKYAWNSDY
jgi:hypothetical protein